MGRTKGNGSFEAGCFPSFLVTAALPSVAIGVTIVIAGLSHAKADLIFQVIPHVILLAIVVPNGLVGFQLLRHDQSASVSGFIVGVLLGLVASAVAGMVTFIFVMAFFYGAGM